MNVSWDGSTRKLIHTKCHQKSYHNDIKGHMTLNTIFSAVIPRSPKYHCNEHDKRKCNAKVHKMLTTMHQKITINFLFFILFYLGRCALVILLLFLIGHLYLNSVWFGVAPKHE